MDMISTDVEEGTVMIFDKRLSIREARELRNQLNEFLFVTGEYERDELLTFGELSDKMEW